MTTTKKVSRGRPASFDKDKAVAIALSEFQKSGYDGVGVARLGAAIGVNPPSLYAAFGSKLGLFERALEAYSTQPDSFTARALSSPGPVADALEAMLHEAARIYSADREHAGCLVMDGTRNCADAAAIAIGERYKKRLRGAIAAFAAREAPEAADDIAGYVMFLLAGLSAASRDGASEEELERFVMRAMPGLRDALGG